MTSQMRAVSLRSFGGPEVLELVDVDRPEPGPGEVLVRVQAIGVNPADWKLRSGLLPKFGQPPITPGLDFSGVVEETGEAVYGCLRSVRGSYAEYVLAPVGALTRTPTTIDQIHAAALPVAALTAWQSLVGVGQVHAGQRVLVHAAAGGIGHLAVQIAKANGAYVIGTARPENHVFVKDLGADDVIDYTSTDFATAARDIDIVLDPISGDYAVRSLDTLVPGGLLLDVRGTGPDRSVVQAEAAARGLRFTAFGFTPSGPDLDVIAGLVDRGQVRVHVEKVFGLGEVAQAHRLLETGHGRGKLVLSTAPGVS